MANNLARGDIWYADFNPIRGHEQSGVRPALIVSADAFHRGPAELVMVLPLTTKQRGLPSRVAMLPPEGGVREASYVMVDQLRTISHDRLRDRIGTASPLTLSIVEDRLRLLLDL